MVHQFAQSSGLETDRCYKARFSLRRARLAAEDNDKVSLWHQRLWGKVLVRAEVDCMGRRIFAGVRGVAVGGRSLPYRSAKPKMAY